MKRVTIRRITCLLCIIMVTAVFSGSPAFAEGKLNAPAIKVTQADSTKIKVTIKKVSGADGYNIYRSKNANSGFRFVKTVKSFKSAKKAYTDTKLKPSTRYYYKVRAYSITGDKKRLGGFSKVKYAETKARGNAMKYDVSNVVFVDSDLNGKTAYFLGSSVTRGKGSEGQSFVDFLKKKYGLKVKKEAVDGTLLIDKGDKSYIKRLNNMKDLHAPDYFVCQLSTNDATKGSELGTIKPNQFNITSFDTMTVAGAIEYITAFSKKYWKCPVVFYISKTKDGWNYLSQYKEMIMKLEEAQEKWGDTQLQIIYVNDAQFKSESEADLCMIDMIHPTKAGYLKKFLPFFENWFLKLYKKNTQETKQVTEPEDTVQVVPEQEDTVQVVPEQEDTVQMNSAPEETQPEEVPEEELTAEDNAA